MQIVLKSPVTNFYSKMPQEVAFQDLLTSLYVKHRLIGETERTSGVPNPHTEFELAM